MLKFLLDENADIDTTSKALGTVLHAALQRPHFSIAKDLIKSGCCIDKHWRTSDGHDFGSPLQIASEQGRIEVVPFLCCHGANINDDGGSNGTALQVAASAGHLEIVRLLLQNGADINAPAKSKGSAILATIMSQQYEIAELLLANGGDINSFIRIDDMLNRLQVHLDRCAGLEARGTALQAAAAY